MIEIVGLGPAGIDAMSVAGLHAVESGDKLYLRTGRHPAAQELAKRGLRFQTFDHVYEAARDFDEVYKSITATLIQESRAADLIYAVPGHPLVAERTVEIILGLAGPVGFDVSLVASRSFIDACFEALGIPLGSGIKLVDALALGEVRPAADCPNLIYQVYSRMIASEVKLALMDVYPDEFDVHIVYGAGGAEASIRRVPLWEMDRVDYDHLTSVYVPSRSL